MSPIFPGRFAGVAMLITGGASGIGRATAERAAAEGARVAILDRNGEAAAKLARTLSRNDRPAVALSADITDEAAVARAMREAVSALGRLGILINNAGISTINSFEDSEPSRWRAEIDLNLTGHWLVTRAALPSLLERGGAIVNVASVNGVTAISEPPYSAAKAGLIQLTRQLATDYGPRGLRTNAVVPGTIRTPIWDQRLAGQPDVFEGLRKWYPVGRVGKPEEVAAAILFLASSEASFINGALLAVDGGLTAGLGPMRRDIIGEPPSDS